MRRLIVLFVTALCLAQVPPLQQYTATDTISSSSGESFTLQLPASSNRTLVPDSSALFWGSINAAFTACIYTGSTTVTGTNATVVSLPGNNAAIPRQVVVLTGSSASGGTGCTAYSGASPFAFSGVNLYKGASAVQTVTITVTPATGTISGYINAKWSEQ